MEPPSVSVTSPANGATLILPTAVVSATATDNVGVTRVEFSSQPTSGLNLTLTNVPYTSVWVPLCNGNITLTARGFDACGNSSDSSITVRVNVLLLPSCGPSIASASRPLLVRSLLTVPRARALATINGVAQAIPLGESAGSFPPRAGANRLEARLTEAVGSAGTWSFDVPGLTPGNVQVQAGEVVQLAAGRIVFRMVGRVGERIAFVFRTEP